MIPYIKYTSFLFMAIAPIVALGQNHTYQDYEKIERKYFLRNEFLFDLNDFSKVQAKLQDCLSFDQEMTVFYKEVSTKTYQDSSWVPLGKLMQFIYLNKVDICFLYLKLRDNDNAIKQFKASLPYSDYHRVGISPKEEFEMTNEHYELPQNTYNDFVNYALSELKKHL